MATITAANIQFTLSIPAVFPGAPMLLQGYATDDAFATERVEPTEAILGVDGIASFAYVPYLTKTTISLQADSPSLFIFDTWVGRQNANNEVYLATGYISYPSISKTFSLNNGAITGLVAFPAAKKILQPSMFEITWQDVTPGVL